MKRIVFFGISLCLVIFTSPMLLADGGKIPFRAHVKIFEPNQNAMIAWNGEEEILLLTTNIRSSEPTKVLEIVPFPSEPKAKKGDSELIRKAVALINSKLRPITFKPHVSGGSHVLSGRSAFQTQKPPAGEMTFHEKIGSHDISVTHVLNNEGFIDWVQKYLKSAGVDNPEIPEDMQKVVGEYLADGFNWFVFDVVDVKQDIATTEAIQYQFKTKSLFYPMRISRAIQGVSQVKLIALTRDLLLAEKDVGVPMITPHRPVYVSETEAQEKIHPAMTTIFQLEERRLALRILEFSGKLSSFKNDLVASSLGKYSSDFDAELTARQGTILVAAVKQADLNAVRNLLDKGVSPNMSPKLPIIGGNTPQNPIANTPLFIASANGFADIAKVLLERGADINEKYWGNAPRNTPLMAAAAGGRVRIIRMLIKRGANLNEQDREGQTALHYAAQLGREESVRLLLQQGAKTELKNAAGRTPSQLAAEHGYTKIVKLLQPREEK